MLLSVVYCSQKAEVLKIGEQRGMKDRRGITVSPGKGTVGWSTTTHMGVFQVHGGRYIVDTIGVKHGANYKGPHWQKWDTSR